MKWLVLAPFFHSTHDRWIDNYCPNNVHTFDHIVPSSTHDIWHNRGGMTKLSEWGSHYKRCSAATRIKSDGFITVFPQLPTLLGFRKKFLKDERPIVAWCFNLGDCYPGLHQFLARIALSMVDIFIVHSRGEIRHYSKWLDIPEEKVVFVPLQRGNIKITEKENMQDSFILSMGTARRDYRTLFSAVKNLNIRTVIVAGPSAINGLEVPSCVEVLSGLSHQQCRELVQQARLSIVPVLNDKTASGQITIVEAMMMGRPVIATQCLGSIDYIQNKKTGILVPPQQSTALEKAISSLWQDDSLRNRLSRNAKEYARNYFSDEEAGIALELILNRFL